MFKKIIVLSSVLMSVGCTDADVASRNLSKAAEMFELERRIVFYNGITGGYILTLEGRCSVSTGNTGNTLAVTCKTGNDDFKKHYLGLSDNVTYFSEQLEPADINTFRYRVIFKPTVIIPDFDLVTP